MSDPDAPARQLAALWERMRPLAVQRLDTVIAAISEVGNDSLSDERRAEAEAAAHKLVGSLGMYGHQSATATLRLAETILGPNGNPPVPPALTDDLLRVRRALTSASP